MARRCAPGGRPDADLLQRHQRALHGLAWIATLVEAIQAAAQWGERLGQHGRLGLGEELALTLGIGEYLAQLMGGVPMSQNEIFRPAELELDASASAMGSDASVRWFVALGSLPETRRALVEQLREGRALAETSFDDDLDVIRDQFRRFAEREITPHAHAWRLADALIPDPLVAALAELGVFGVSIAAEYGGIGLGKRAMCIVTEELSRAWIAAGLLGTRSEIAAELIVSAGTAEQNALWLPKLASGEVLPTAVFTEPDAGSDLASLRTRATPLPNGAWRIDGNKTWITHAARSDLMTLLARTEPGSTGHEGLSKLLAAKPRGAREQPFPAPGMSGSEIHVLGYRGMRASSTSSRARQRSRRR